MQRCSLLLNVPVHIDMYEEAFEARYFPKRHFRDEVTCAR